MKNPGSFYISAQNIDCGCLLEPPRRGGSNEYQQSMFFCGNKKYNVYPCKQKFYYIKWGLRGAGSKLYRHVFVMPAWLKSLICYVCEWVLFLALQLFVHFKPPVPSHLNLDRYEAGFRIV